MALSISASCVCAENTAWGKYTDFNVWLGVWANLSDIQDQFPILKNFPHQVHTGLLEARGRHIQKESVEKYIRSAEQIFFSVEAIKPRMDMLGNVNFRI